MSAGVSAAPRRLHPPARQRLLTGRRDIAVLAILAGTAVLVGASALPSVDLLAMNDLGLVSVLPPQLLLAILAVTVGFLVTLSRPRLRVPLVVAYLALLLVTLYGLPAFVADEAGHHVAWRHAGIVDYIVRHGSVDGTIDAYFNWPGFFILAAFVTQAADASDVLSYSNWAPLFFNLLYLGPLLMIFRTASGDRRVVWLAVGLFYLTNWVGQDYFSPQALTYFLYLCLVAVLLRWFVSVDRDRVARSGPSGLRALAGRRLKREAPATAPVTTPTRGHVGASGWERALLLGVAVLLFAATVPSHQLTPFAAFLSVGLLVLLRRCYARALPLLMAVVTVSWIAFMTVAYLEGHLEQLLGGIGDLAAAADENVSERVGGSAAHALVVKLRLLETGGLWLLAAIGAFLRFRDGRRDGTFVALALAPFPLVALQSYGGEMLLRVYLFSLPFVVFFVATLLSRAVFARGRGSVLRGVALGAAAILLVTGFLLARYGNERTNVFSSDEVAAVERLYEIAPPGAKLIAGSVNVPWKAEHYDLYDHEYVTETAAWEQPDGRRLDLPAVAREVAGSMREDGHRNAFLLTTERQRAYVNLLGPAPHGSLARFERALSRSGRFHVYYENGDARIWKLRGAAEPG